ncbi:MAG: hypothetical protein ABSB56_02780 [Nitrososphaerales archaeon]
MFEERPVTWRTRISRAITEFVINLILWVIIPSFLLGLISGSLSSSPVPITYAFIYTFGAIIIGLQVLGALTEGMVVSIPLVTGSHVAVAYYIYAAVNGGTLALTAAGMGLSLDIRPLLYLIMLPSLFSAVRVPLAYLAEEHEAARPATDFA